MMEVARFLTSFCLWITYISATALTVALEPHETVCYYVLTKQPNTTVGFYFAVQSGGNFDIDFAVKDTNKKVFIKGNKERQGDWSFKAADVGEYEFCFANGMSTFAEKVVDFEIRLEDDFKAEIPNFQKTSENEPVEGMIFAVSSIELKMNNVLRTLSYYKTRNNRNQQTVSSTMTRILTFSVSEVALMAALALMQVYLVHVVFRKHRKVAV